MALNNPLTDAASLSDALRQRVGQLEEALLGCDDALADRRPTEGEWTVKQIVVHLLGPVHGGPLHDLSRALEEDHPTLTIDDGVCDMSVGRRATPMSELAPIVLREYGALASFVGALGGRELARPVDVPELEGTPTGSRPTLAQYLHALEMHLAGHCQQIAATRRLVEAD